MFVYPTGARKITFCCAKITLNFAGCGIAVSLHLKEIPMLKKKKNTVTSAVLWVVSGFETGV